MSANNFKIGGFWFQKNTNCGGTAAPDSSGLRQYKTVSMVSQPDGWFLLKGDCVSGCTGSVSIAAKMGVVVREIKDESQPLVGPTTFYSNGPK